MERSVISSSGGKDYRQACPSHQRQYPTGEGKVAEKVGELIVGTLLIEALQFGVLKHSALHLSNHLARRNVTWNAP